MKKTFEIVAMLVGLLVVGGLLWFARTGNTILPQNQEGVRVAVKDVQGQPLARVKVQFRWPPAACMPDHRCAAEVAFEGTTDAEGKMLVNQNVFARDQILVDLVGDYRPGEYPTVTIFRDPNTGIVSIPHQSIQGVQYSSFDPRREEVDISFVPSSIVF